ncbi:MAG TPA: hypothetical protein VK547_09730 [Candidatus Udaeobacter sp.]|nr:hypothetical protein [Candidatus Udaeobacter sp.]
MTAQTAPAGIQTGDRVSLFVSESPDRVSGVVRRVYPNVIGSAVAEVELPGGRTVVQNVEFLRLA